jgi:predicted MFS family arabinose efflux permease
VIGLIIGYIIVGLIVGAIAGGLIAHAIGVGVILTFIISIAVAALLVYFISGSRSRGRSGMRV